MVTADRRRVVGPATGDLCISLTMRAKIVAAWSPRGIASFSGDCPFPVSFGSGRAVEKERRKESKRVRS